MKWMTGLYLPLIGAALLAPGIARSQQKTAVLISVSKYQNAAGIPDLGYAKDKQYDIIEMTDPMVKRGFAIKPLENANATRQKILDVLKDVSAKAKADDAIVLYFSGHGAYEKGRFHLCGFDALAKSSENDITEDEIDQWLKKLPTHNVTIILDCCFTPIVARASSTIRKEKFVGRSDTGFQSEDTQIHLLKGAVLLVAAGQNGCAYQDRKFPDGWAGLFTYYLSEEIYKANPETTFRQIMEHVRARIREETKGTTPSDEQKYPRQSPTLYGAEALVNRPLFSDVKAEDVPTEKPEATPVVVPEHAPAIPPATPVVRPYLTITKVSDIKLTLNQGKKEGVTVGSEYALFPDGETKFEDAHKLGVLRVNEVGETQATGTLLAGSKTGDISAPCRAVLTRQAADVTHANSVAVRVEGAAAFQTQMMQALQKCVAVKVVNGQQPADMVLRGRMAGGKIEVGMFEGDGISPSAVNADKSARILQADTADDLVQKQIGPELNMIASYHNLSNLKNPNPGMHVELATKFPVYVEGEHPEFTFTSDRDCYLFLYAVDPIGYPSLIFPYPSNASNHVRAGEVLQVPPKGVPGIDLYAPFGNMRMVAVAIADPKKAQELQNSLMDLEKAGTPEQNKSRVVRIGQAAQSVQSASVEDWNVFTLEMQIISQKQKMERNKEAESQRKASGKP